MSELLFRFFLALYRPLFCRKRFYKLNKLLFDLSVRGLGILNYENDRVSGEGYLFRKVFPAVGPMVVMDVGANTGDYAAKVRLFAPAATIYAFEPHPATFRALQPKATRSGFRAFNIGFSDVAGTMQLYDRVAGGDGTQHASLYREVIEDIHEADATAVEVTVSTIDSFVADHGIDRIHLLKIDTEGNELKVLQGAEKMLAARRVDMVQIEFNEMNTVSRVFFRDFHRLLEGFDCYRLLPDGLLPIPRYRPLQCELFAFQNLLFIHRGLQEARTAL